MPSKSTPDNPTPAEQERDQLLISNRIHRFFLRAIGYLALIAAVGFVSYYAGSNKPASSGAATAQPTPTAVTVAMHDPGCHWFQVGTQLKKSLSVSGPVKLLNSDEDAIKIAGSAGTVSDAVGQRVTLDPGSYRIKMVGQASDDNTLHLAVT
jgi:hypothetical protein